MIGIRFVDDVTKRARGRLAKPRKCENDGGMTRERFANLA